MDTKVIGYSLLGAGILITLIVLFNLYSILTGNSKAFDYFDFEPISISTEMFLGSELSTEERLIIKQQNGGEFPQFEVASKSMLNDTSNLLAHLFLLGSIASVSTKISMVGVNLIRPIKVKLNKENGENKEIQTK